MYPRKGCEIPVVGKQLLTDIGLGGAFVQGMTVGNQQTVRFDVSLPHRPRSIAVNGKVVYTRPATDEQPHGCGVQFSHLEFRSRVAVQSFVMNETNGLIDDEPSFQRAVAETQRFLEDTRHDSLSVHPKFKQLVSDFHSYLTRFREHLDHVERTLLPHNHSKEEALDAFFDLFEEEFQARVHKFILDIYEVIKSFGEEEDALHRKYFQTVLTDITSDSAVFNRASNKPLGYAGDYVMMNLLYKGIREGETAWNRMINSCLTSIPLGAAVRNRAWYLRDWIKKTAAIAEQAQIMSLACGPCEEVRLFMQQDAGSAIDFYLVDQDTSALRYAEEYLGSLPFRGGRQECHFAEINIRAFLRGEERLDHFPKMDLIYAAGLYDYLRTSTAKRLTELAYMQLAPGGVLIIGNFVAGNPFGYFIEYASDWFLIYRSEQEMLCLAPDDVPEDHRWVETEPSGVNLFLCIRKPQDTSGCSPHRTSGDEP